MTRKQVLNLWNEEFSWLCKGSTLSWETFKTFSFEVNTLDELRTLTNSRIRRILAKGK